jgi:uncharacterized protein YozE (UPF0346 family)
MSDLLIRDLTVRLHHTLSNPTKWNQNGHYWADQHGKVVYDPFHATRYCVMGYVRAKNWKLLQEFSRFANRVFQDSEFCQDSEDNVARFNDRTDHPTLMRFLDLLVEQS